LRRIARKNNQVRDVQGYYVGKMLKGNKDSLRQERGPNRNRNANERSRGGLSRFSERVERVVKKSPAAGGEEGRRNFDNGARHS